MAPETSVTVLADPVEIQIWDDFMNDLQINIQDGMVHLASVQLLRETRDSLQQRILDFPSDGNTATLLILDKKVAQLSALISDREHRRLTEDVVCVLTAKLHQTLVSLFTMDRLKAALEELVDEHSVPTTMRLIAKRALLSFYNPGAVMTLFMKLSAEYRKQMHIDPRITPLVETCVGQTEAYLELLQSKGVSAFSMKDAQPATGA